MHIESHTVCLDYITEEDVIYKVTLFITEIALNLQIFDKRTSITVH